MIITYEITDEDIVYIQIVSNNEQGNTIKKCNKLDFSIKYFKDGTNFLTQIKKNDLENLSYCESIFEFALTNEDKEDFLKKLNDYRQGRNFIPFYKNINNITYKDYKDQKKSFKLIEKRITNLALRLSDSMGKIATEKGNQLQDTLLDLINNPNLYIEEPPKNYNSIMPSVSEKDLIKILKKYTNEDKIIEDYLNYFL